MNSSFLYNVSNMKRQMRWISAHLPLQYICTYYKSSINDEDLSDIRLMSNLLSHSDILACSRVYTRHEAALPELFVLQVTGITLPAVSALFSLGHGV